VTKKTASPSRAVRDRSGGRPGGERTGTRTAHAPSGRTQYELTNARTRIVGTRQGRLADGIVTLVRVGESVGRMAGAAWARLSQVVTGLGWAMIVIVAAAFWAGYALGWVEAVVIAWTGLVLIAVSVLHLVGRNAHRVRLSMPGNRVVVGEKAAGDVVAANPTRFRLPAVRVEVPVGAGLAEFGMPSLAPGADHDEVFFVPTAHRGIIPIGPVRTVRADPIGLLRREVVWAGGLDLYVHPRTVTLPSTSTGFIKDLEGSSTTDLTPSDMAFHALREYMPGDERRNIHWKSTAKTGSFMVRQYEETRRSHLMVALSLAAADYESDDDFELAVGVAASLGIRAIRDARTVSVVASAVTPDYAKRTVHAMRTLSTVNRTRLLDDLAGVETAATALPLVDLAGVAADSAAGVSVAFLVCGPGVQPGELRAASLAFPLGVEVIAVVCSSEAPPSFLRVAELSVITVGYLDDLQKSLMRRAAVA